MSDDLIIKIGADNSGVGQAFDDIKAQTADLEDNLNTAAKISGIAFAALAAQVTVALGAFEESDAASRALSTSLQNQGIYTDALKDSYLEYADSVSKSTGFSKDQIVQAQATAQQFLGQIPVTEKLTQAIADYAQAQGISLPAAAAQMAKAIQNGTGMLVRQGLAISSTSTEAERYGQVVDFVTQKYGGQAAAANQGLGSIRGLEAAFKESQVTLGEKFAPAATAVIALLTNFLTPAKGATDSMVDLKAGFIAAGLAVTALGVALPVAAQGFLTVRAAIAAVNIGLTGTQIALAGLGIGVVIFLVTELALNWESASKRIIAVVQGMVQFVSGAFTGLGTVIAGAFHLDPAKITEGLKQIQDAFAGGINTAMQTIPAATTKALTEQDAIKKEFASKDAAFRAQQDADRKALATAEHQAVLLELTGASQAQIDLKKQETQAIKALETTKDADLKDLLRAHIAQIQQLEQQQITDDMKRETEFATDQLAAKKSLSDRNIQADVQLNQKELAQIKSSQLTQLDADKKVYTDELTLQIKANNAFLEEKTKYGVAYATINQAIHSEELQGTKQATGDLVALTQSNNETLKTIGKAATISQIIIKTGESAMNIFSGFSSIPFVGYALGIAGAAAAVAFGAEQIGNVTAAAQGGLVGGSGYGDTQPYMLTPGELVVPKQNFSQVVSSYAASQSGTTDPNSATGVVQLELSLKGNFMDLIETKLVQRKNLKLSIQRST